MCPALILQYLLTAWAVISCYNLAIWLRVSKRGCNFSSTILQNNNLTFMNNIFALELFSPHLKPHIILIILLLHLDRNWTNIRPKENKKWTREFFSYMTPFWPEILITCRANISKLLFALSFICFDGPMFVFCLSCVLCVFVCVRVCVCVCLFVVCVCVCVCVCVFCLCVCVCVDKRILIASKC